MSLIRCLNNPEALYIYQGCTGISINPSGQGDTLGNTKESFYVPSQDFFKVMRKFAKSGCKKTYRSHDFEMSSVNLDFKTLEENPTLMYDVQYLSVKQLKDWYKNDKYGIYKEYKTVDDCVKGYKKSGQFIWISNKKYLQEQARFRRTHDQVKMKYKEQFIYMWETTFWYIYDNMGN